METKGIKQIELLGQKIKVRYIEDLKDEEGNELDGQYHPNLDIIDLNVLNIKETKQFFKRVLLHEAFHAFVEIAQVQLSAKEEERLCQLFERVFFDFQRISRRIDRIKD